MTSDELKSLNEQIAAQTGVKIEDLSKASILYSSLLVNIDQAVAIDALRAMMMAGTAPRQAGHVIAAIIRNAGVRPQSAITQKEEHPGCDNCRFSGAIEVPHHRDFDINNFWKGQYTMVVSCDCQKGLNLNIGMTIHTYNAMRPNWREEYPIRNLEFQQRNLIQSIDSEHVSEIRKASLRSKLIFVNQEMMNLMAAGNAAA